MEPAVNGLDRFNRVLNQSWWGFTDSNQIEKIENE